MRVKPSAHNAALAFMARREHFTAELERKLLAMRYSPGEVQAVLERLHREGLLSDARSAEAWTREWIRRGWGPVRIRLELERRGMERPLAERAVAGYPCSWSALARTQLEKRCGQRLPTDYRERARLQAYLERRGFTAEHVRAALAGTAGAE